MTQHHQIAIDLMNEVISTFASTDEETERMASYERLVRYLLDNFEAPEYPRDQKNTLEYELWMTHADGVGRVLETSANELEASLLSSPTDFTLSSSFVCAVMRVCMSGRRCVCNPGKLPSFFDFHKKYDRLIVTANSSII